MFHSWMVIAHCELSESMQTRHIVQILASTIHDLQRKTFKASFKDPTSTLLTTGIRTGPLASKGAKTIVPDSKILGAIRRSQLMSFPSKTETTMGSWNAPTVMQALTYSSRVPDSRKEAIVSKASHHIIPTLIPQTDTIRKQNKTNKNQWKRNETTHKTSVEKAAKEDR